MRMFLVVALLFASSSAFAAELDKKQAGLLTRVEFQITAFEQQLARATDNGRSLTARLVEDFERKIAKQDEALATLPADSEEVKKVVAHMTAFKATWAAKAAAFQSATQAAGDEKAGFIALFTSPESAADIETLTQLEEMFKHVSMYDLSNYHFARWPTHSTNVEQRGWNEGWAESQKKYAALRTKYEAGAATKTVLGGQAGMLQAKFIISLRGSERGFAPFKAAVEAFAKEAPGQIEKDGATLKAETEKAVAGKDFDAFLRNEGTIEGLRYRITNLAAVWAPLAPSDEARSKVEARSKAILAEADATMEKLAELIIKENRAPKQQYTGDDRAKLESYVRGMWAKHFPAESILGVRFGAAAFERQTSWIYVPSARAFMKVDRSTLPVWVVVKDGAKQAIMWFSVLTRQHMKGDELEMNWIDRPSRGASPDHRMLLANFK